MKILKIKVSGFKRLADDFTVDFLSKARVNEMDKDDEIIALAESLYMPTSTVFTGKNASGKSTVLSLLKWVHELLDKGRIKYDPMHFNQSSIQLDVYFFHQEKVYRYQGTVNQPPLKVMEGDFYCEFSSERLGFKKYYKSNGKKILDMDFTPSPKFTSSVPDTSILYQVTLGKHYAIQAEDWVNPLKLYRIFDWFEGFKLNQELILRISQLFDEGIEIFTYDRDRQLYTVKLKGTTRQTYTEDEVNAYLSEGTKKGLVLLALAIAMLSVGGDLIIDEIENSFHKNLVENLIMIFNDKRINKNQATLIFTTHYVEILDIFRRRDHIYIMQKDETISLENLYEDYAERVELSKSNQFNNNTFKTLINYERLMDLKKVLMHEIPHFT